MSADGGFGPLARNLDSAERVARSRALAALVRVFAGPAAGLLVVALHRLERDAQPLTRRWPCSTPYRPVRDATHSAPMPRFTQAAMPPPDPARSFSDGCGA